MGKRKKPTISAKEKKHIEFSKKVVVVAFAIFIAMVINSYVLAYMEKANPLESLSSAIIITPVATILGYYTQNSVRAWSRNKYISTTEQTTEIIYTGGHGRGEL